MLFGGKSINIHHSPHIFLLDFASTAAQKLLIHLAESISPTFTSLNHPSIHPSAFSFIHSFHSSYIIPGTSSFPNLACVRVTVCERVRHAKLISASSTHFIYTCCRALISITTVITHRAKQVVNCHIKMFLSAWKIRMRDSLMGLYVSVSGCAINFSNSLFLLFPTTNTLYNENAYTRIQT